MAGATLGIREWKQRIESRPLLAASLVGALAALVGLAKYGLQMWPAWVNLYEAARLWTNPTQGALLQPPQDYILSSSLTAMILGALHLTWQPLYVAIQVVLAIVAIVLPFAMPVIRDNLDSARVMFVMLAGGPIVALLLTWVGGYDALCVIAAAVAVLARSRIVGAAGWFILAVNHSSVAAIGCALWIGFLLIGLRRVEQDRVELRIATAVIGVLAGSLTMWLVTQGWGGVTSRFEAFRLYGLDYYWNAFTAGMPLLLFGALGVGWIVLLDSRVRRTRAARVVLIEVLGAALIVPFVALDESRMIALVTIPTVLAWVACTPFTLDAAVVRSLWSRYAIPAAIVPVVMITIGSMGPFGLQLLLHWRAGF